MLARVMLAGVPVSVPATAELGDPAGDTVRDVREADDGRGTLGNDDDLPLLLLRQRRPVEVHLAQLRTSEVGTL